MLTIKSMQWDNCFSFGDNNLIDFDREPLTQLVGINGSGKTSISLVLQEVLYGKNIKSIKKQDITNNKSNKQGYRIELFFEKDNDKYVIKLNRTSNLKFRLFKNGEDISSHTSLNTYKTLANIIGISDFKVFCQLIYQHSTDSLEFLTATDTNRKRFLINLLQLDRYIELHEKFKSISKGINSNILVLEGKVTVIESWINEHKDMDFMKQNIIEAVFIPTKLVLKAAKLKTNIDNIHNINRKITSNQEYIKQLDTLDPEYYLNSAPMSVKLSSQELRAQVRVIENQYTQHQNKINKLNNVQGQCPECLQEVDLERKNLMIDDEIEARDYEKTKMGFLWNQIVESEKAEIEIKRYKEEKEKFERFNQLIDSTIPSKTLDLNELKIELATTLSKISKLEMLIKSTEAENLKISAHNSKVDVVKEQLKKMKEDLQEQNINLMEKENLSDILELLKKTFGTNGLVSYKIESSVKELEKEINKYLSDLTYFQIYFKLSGERLNIEVLDDVGNVTSISNLSSGERARVNIATILAIRKILASLTSTKINLLFLDEVIGVIDAEGKEKLSEILLKENLNTFIVSHDWSHPLIPRINIVKEKHISRIEHE